MSLQYLKAPSRQYVLLLRERDSVLKGNQTANDLGMWQDD